MYCLTCNEFAQLKVVAEQMGPKVPGLEETINAYLMWHLAVIHNLSYADLHEQAGVPRSIDEGSSS